jgi:hypothetical protein
MCRAYSLVLSVLLVACTGDAVAPRPAAVADGPKPLPSVQGDANGPEGAGRLVVWGDNSAQQISAAPVGEEMRALAAGGPRQGLAIRADGSLVLWGGSGNVPPLPGSVANGRYDSAVLALTYLLAVRNDHSVEPWGSFVGGGSAAPPTRLKARAVAGGASFGIAIQVDHTLETWGPGAAGRTRPAGKFIAVAGRSANVIALRRDGTLFGWGAPPAAAPDIFTTGWVRDGAGHFLVPNDRFVAIAAGNNHILALRADGTVAGWGRDLPGAECCATKAPAGVRFTAIAAGSDYSIGLDPDGAIHLWGDGREGRSAVPTGRLAAIAAAARHAAALRLDGKSKN